MKNVSIITVADSEITFDTKIVTKIVTDRSHGREKNICQPYCSKEDFMKNGTIYETILHNQLLSLQETPYCKFFEQKSSIKETQNFVCDACKFFLLCDIMKKIKIFLSKIDVKPKI